MLLGSGGLVWPECQPGGGTDSVSPGMPRWYENDDRGEGSVHRSGRPWFL